MGAKKFSAIGMATGDSKKCNKKRNTHVNIYKIFALTYFVLNKKIVLCEN